MENSTLVANSTLVSSWEVGSEVCKPINEGGLGIRHAKSKKLSLLAKICWRCLKSNDLLCPRILKAKYCPNKSLWEAIYWNCNFWFWKGFVEGVNFIEERAGWIIGTGENINAWNCKWIPCKDGLSKPFSNMVNRKPFSNMVNRNLTVRLMEPGQEMEWNHY